MSPVHAALPLPCHECSFDLGAPSTIEKHTYIDAERAEVELESVCVLVFLLFLVTAVVVGANNDY